MLNYNLIFLVLALVAAGLLLFKFRNTIKQPQGYLYAAGGVVASALLTLGVVNVGSNVSVNDSLTFQEYWNGYELEAKETVVECARDGRCKQTYQCDPYTETETYIDFEGNPKTRIVTKYHSCPYSTTETTYSIVNTLGTHVVGANLPTGQEWRSGRSVPGGIQETPPEVWLNAQERLAEGATRGVTERNEYTNYIQATEVDFYKENQEKVDELLEAGALPEPAKKEGYYNVNKVYDPDNVLSDNLRQQYTSDVTYFNSVLGTELQGDLHVVFVDSGYNSSEYTNALKAYWTNPVMLGKDTSAKNTIVVTVGVNSSGISWVNSFTGMPEGNEELLAELNSLGEKPLDENFIGSPSYNIIDNFIRETNGVLEDIILFGDNKFERVSMGDENTEEGYAHLKTLVKVPTSHYITMGVINFILLAAIWGFVWYLFQNAITTKRRSSYYW